MMQSGTRLIEGREVGSHFDGKSKALTSVVPRSRKRASNGTYKHSWFDSKTLDQLAFTREISHALQVRILSSPARGMWRNWQTHLFGKQANS